VGGAARPVLEPVGFCGGSFPRAACGVGWGRISPSFPVWLSGFSCVSLCLQVFVGLATAVAYRLFGAAFICFCSFRCFLGGACPRLWGLRVFFVVVWWRVACDSSGVFCSNFCVNLFIYLYISILPFKKKKDVP